ncbi:hypothetical protein E2C01_039841 [Portunus trituberculatus]|uniref:Uncharacterized protein n=1 Tax=Portunus trituberculatus TaxID=210409 RepID=A0A5B7FI14_PORTR|nr:hypothetical protein [Portunus trituberculatus]
MKSVNYQPLTEIVCSERNTRNKQQGKNLQCNVFFTGDDPCITAMTVTLRSHTRSKGEEASKEHT